MATYAIGDLQGCFEPLLRLLKEIDFHPERDTLWFTGDLVNRGPQSLETLRYVKNLGNKHITVLGNHDLHLLARAHGVYADRPDDTLNEILQATDKNELIHWLIQQPLLHYDAELNYTMVHAGLAASWDLSTARQLAKEVEDVLQSQSAVTFFEHMYGNLPDQWQNDLTGWDRLRCITNYFTRLRYCYADGRIELKSKGTLGSHASELTPWFKVKPRANADLNIVFGHWAALGGETHTPNTFALDTGCVWGNKLTAMRLEDKKRFAVPANYSNIV